MTDTDIKQTIRSIRSLAVVFDGLNSMDDSELEMLIQGKGNLRFVPTAERGEVARKPKSDDSQLLPSNGENRMGEAKLQLEVDEAARLLNEANSREEAKNLIASINVPKGKGRKDFLIRLAKACAVQVESRDAIARIEQKLVEKTVGAKLRSKAFREVAF